MKYVILVGDGMGDYPLAELDNRTPLQAAHTPTIDELCRKSTLLGLSTVPEGFPPGSDVANMSLLGYDPRLYYTGRAPLEAASMGVTLAADETAFRCNLVTLEYQDDNRAVMIDFSAGHISSEESAQLIAAVQKSCGNSRFQFYPGISYRHLLVVRDPIEDLDTVPPHDYIGKDVSSAYQAYLNTPGWQDVVSQARSVLDGHPVNRSRLDAGKRPASGIWPWGEGKMPDLPSLAERFSIRGTMISAVDLLNGLGICAGLSVAHVEGATGYIDTNYAGKAQAALEALDSEDFVFVHLEGPDEAGHQANLAHKIQAIEDFDAKIVAPISEELARRGEPFRLVVTMDHFTPLSIQTHTDQAVPAFLYDSRQTQQGSGQPFDESILSDGTDRIQSIAGHNLINHLLQSDQ